MRGALLATAFLLVAGCAGQGAPSATTDDLTYRPPSFGEDTGAIDGLVLSDEVLALGDVTVVMAPVAQVTRTGPDGRFSFNHLSPGEYALFANRTGYESVTTRAIVEAGRATPVRLQMAAIGPSNSTFVDAKQFVGYTLCTVSYRSSVNYLRPSCSLVNANAGGTWNFRHEAKPGFHEYLLEVHWRPTYAYGNALFQALGILNGSFLGVAEKESGSPLRMPLNNSYWPPKFASTGVNLTQRGGTLTMSTFAAHNLGGVGGVQLGMVLDQRFTLESSIAYGGPLAPEYTRLKDG